MNQQQLLRAFPDMEYDELSAIMKITQNFSEQQQQDFLAIYQGKRKDKQLILILTLLGFFGFAGIHRIIIGDIALGILYFFTVGLCFIGTIVDLVNFKRLATEYNVKMAYESANLATSVFR